MTLRLNGNTSGYTEIDAPAVAGSNTLLLPASNGSAYQFLRNGATAGTTEFAAAITSSTAVASTSGTSIDFTSIPSYVKRITIMGDGVSSNGTSSFQAQIGSGSVVTSAYVSTFMNGDGGAVYTSTSGFLISQWLGSNTLNRNIICTLVNVTGNTWLSSVNTHVQANTSGSGTGKLALAGTLDRVRITTVNGTDTFDAGSINILYEG